MLSLRSLYPLSTQNIRSFDHARERGYAKEKTIQKFLAAGYKKEQVMELLLGVALKTISNYLDHIFADSR